MALPSSFAPTSYQQGWGKYAFDQRTFSDLIASILDELDKPDLQQPAINAAQEAVRFWRRKKIFYMERDNRILDTMGWVASQFWTMGATIRVTISTIDYAFVCVREGFSGTIEPTWPAAFAAGPPWGTILTGASTGCVADNEVVWANGGLWSGATQSPVQTGIGFDQYGRSLYWTQLSMVPNINRYRFPLDYMSPKALLVTINGIKYPIDWFPYDWFAQLDMVQPPPLGNYPSQWTYTEQDLIIWPYPNQFSPIFLIYDGPDQPPVNPTDINMWTTIGARLIKAYAKGILNRDVMRDTDAAQADFQAAEEEYGSLELEGIGKLAIAGIPPEVW